MPGYDLENGPFPAELDKSTTGATLTRSTGKRVVNNEFLWIVVRPIADRLVGLAISATDATTVDAATSHHAVITFKQWFIAYDVSNRPIND